MDRLLRRRVGKAIGEFRLIAPGDRILVGLSGGKDSWTLLGVLRSLQRRSPVRFDLAAATIDQGFGGFLPEPIAVRARRDGIAWTLLDEASLQRRRTERMAPERPGEFCAVCSGVRRAALDRLARREGFTTVALGHHMDDVVETLVLNLFYEGRLAAMPPCLETRGLRVIRPLYYVREHEAAAYARAHRYPILCCGCPVCRLSGGEKDRMKRRAVKSLLARLEAEEPGIKRTILGALGRVEERFLPWGGRDPNRARPLRRKRFLNEHDEPGPLPVGEQASDLEGRIGHA